MCNSVLRLQIVLCCFLLTWSLPRKANDLHYGQPREDAGGAMSRGFREEMPRDPWQNSMADLRQYSLPMPPLVPNDEAVKMLKTKPTKRPDLIINVPKNATELSRRSFRMAADDAKMLADQGIAKHTRRMQARPNMRRSMGGGGPDFEQDDYDQTKDIIKGDLGDDYDDIGSEEHGNWDGDEDPANCPRELYLDQLRLDFGTAPPKKYDWEQIGRHFVNYGRFTADMSDDLMRGLDFRFRQMKG